MAILSATLSVLVLLVAIGVGWWASIAIRVAPIPAAGALCLFVALVAWFYFHVFAEDVDSSP
jgi:hypothetical protein